MRPGQVPIPVQLSTSHLEARVRGALARMAGTEVSVIRPDLRLEELGCEPGGTLVDVLEVLEQELGLRAYAELDIPGKKKEKRPPLETVWDLIKVFHRAEAHLRPGETRRAA